MTQETYHTKMHITIQLSKKKCNQHSKSRFNRTNFDCTQKYFLKVCTFMINYTV